MNVLPKQSNDNIPVKVERAIRLTVIWVKDLTDDWVSLKEQILNEVDNDTRKLFTKRDERTKEILELNAMELDIIKLWKQLTGVELKLRSFKERRDIRWWKPVVDFDEDE